MNGEYCRQPEERVVRRESQQENERKMHQDIMGLFQQLKTLMDLQVQPPWAYLPLKSMENSIRALSHIPPLYSTLQKRPHPYPYNFISGDIQDNHNFT